MQHINCLCCLLLGLLFIVIYFSCISCFILIFFSIFPVMLLYSYTQTFSLISLHCWYSYCVSFCALLGGVCLLGNKRITYLLTFLLKWGAAEKVAELFNL